MKRGQRLPGGRRVSGGEQRACYETDDVLVRRRIVAHETCDTLGYLLALGTLKHPDQLGRHGLDTRPYRRSRIRARGYRNGLLVTLDFATFALDDGRAGGKGWVGSAQSTIEHGVG